MPTTKALRCVGIAAFFSIITTILLTLYFIGNGTTDLCAPESYYQYRNIQQNNKAVTSFGGKAVLPFGISNTPPNMMNEELLHVNCSVPKDRGILHFEALWNATDRQLYGCESTTKLKQLERSNALTTSNMPRPSQEEDIPTIFIITPTFARFSQKVDLTTVCHTLMLVPKVVWIVIEDATKKTDLVTRLLDRCKVPSVHLHVKTPPRQKIKRGMKRHSRARGVVQRNTGLKWLRDNCTLDHCNGVFYFGDDDNKYDLRLFEEMRKTEVVSVFPVAFAGGLMFEGPLCKDGKIDKWHTGWEEHRNFPIDMAGFAVNLKQLLQHPKAKIGVDKNGKTPAKGYLETAFLENFLSSRREAECRGSEKELLVWHTHTEQLSLENEASHPSDPKFEM